MITSKAIIKNIELEQSGIEYRFPLPKGTQEFNVRIRETEDLVQIAFVSGNDTTYANLIGNNLQFGQQARNGELFFRTEKGGKTVEVMVKI